MPDSPSNRPRITDARRLHGRRLEAFVRDRWRDRTGIRGLSERVDVSRATLYSWFNGDSAPDTSQLARLADALACSPRDLMGVLEGAPPSMLSGATPSDLRLDVDAIADRAVARYRDELSLEVDRLVGGRAESWQANVAPPEEAALRKVMRYEVRTTDHVAMARPQPADSPRLADLFRGQMVDTCLASDPIGPVMRRMYEKNFSQLPVYDEGRLIGLLTTDTIARWHGARSATVADPASTAGEVLGFAETGPTYRLLGPNATTAQALDSFDVASDAGLRLDAVLITSTGGPSGRPLGIATPADRRLLAARR